MVEVVGVVELFVLPEVTVVLVVTCLAGVVEVPVGTFVGVVVPLPVAGVMSLPAVRFVGLSVLVMRELPLLLGTVTLGRAVVLLPLVLPLKELPPPVVPERPS